MDSFATGLIVTAAIDVAIFVLLVSIYIKIKNYRSKRLDPAMFKEQRMPIVDEVDRPLVPLWDEIIKVPDEEILEKRLPDGFLYLKLHKRLAAAFGVMSLIGCGGLIPVYLAGSVNDLNDLQKASVAHILAEDDFERASAVFICLGVFTFIMFYVLIKFYSESVKLQKRKDKIHYLRLVTLQIDNIPAKLDPAEWNNKLKVFVETSLGAYYGNDEFEEEMPMTRENIVRAYIVPDLNTKFSKLVKLGDNVTKRAYFREKNDRKGKRSKMWVKGGTLKWQKEDALDNLKEQNKTLKSELDEIDQNYEFKQNLQTAFVTFYSERQKCDFQKAFHKKVDDQEEAVSEEDHDLKYISWTLRNASHPADYIWENINVNLSTKKKQYFLLEAGVLIIMVFIIGPTSLVSLAEETLIWAIGSGAAIITQFLPALIMLLFLEVLIPLAIDFFVTKERPSRMSFRANNEAEKYIKFFICLMFVAVLVSIQVVGTFINMEWDDWTQVFAETVIGSGQLFVVFLLQLTFISNGIQLCGFTKYLKGLALAKTAQTEYDEKKAWALIPFELSRHYAIATVVFYISMVYGVIMPFILPVAALFFFTKYYAHRSTLMTCEFVETDSNGLVSKTVLRAMLCGLCVFWFITGVIIMMMKFEIYLSLGAAFCIIGITGIIFVLAFDEKVWNLGSKTINVEKLTNEIKKMRIYENSELLQKAYVHPCERTDPKAPRKLISIEALTSNK